MRPVDLPPERHSQILRLLESRGGVRTTEIAQVLGVSVATVRRDLDALGLRGLIERTHGGALPLQMGTAQEPPFALKAERMRAAKDRIAARAAGLVPEGATVILDSGTTTLALARRLSGRRLTVIALDLPSAQTVAEREGAEVWLAGGRVRNGLFSVIGPWTEEDLGGLFADVFFLAADAVDLEGVTNSTVEEAAVKRLAMAAARETILVADHSKFGRRALARVCGLEALRMIVTDSGIGEIRTALAERVQQIEVV